MAGEWMYGRSELLISIVILVLLVLAVEVGYRAGARASSTINDGAKSHLSTIFGGILGLLALLLGFTFAMSLSRYDLRKRLVTQEANAIGTAYLRSQLLPEPEKKEVADLLRKYVDVRIEFSHAGVDQLRLDPIDGKTQQLQGEIWSRLSSAVAKDDRPVTTGMFQQSVNEAFDLQSERLAAMENHVPESVLILLILIALIDVFCIGYGCGIGKNRHLISTTMLVVLLVLVITGIMDLDRPRRGLIRVSQASMIRLQSSLHQDVP
jgi:hypothetical protein